LTLGRSKKFEAFIDLNRLMPMDHWICETCRGAIAQTDDGLLQLFNSNLALGPTDGPPLEASPDPARRPRPATGTLYPRDENEIEAGEAWHSSNIRFTVAHFRCIANLPRGYEVPLPCDAEEFMAWTIHVGRKSWMGPTDIARMLATYWTHKGANPPPLG
jgi:hypothetical protein